MSGKLARWVGAITVHMGKPAECANMVEMRATCHELMCECRVSQVAAMTAEIHTAFERHAQAATGLLPVRASLVLSPCGLRCGRLQVASGTFGAALRDMQLDFTPSEVRFFAEQGQPGCR